MSTDFTREQYITMHRILWNKIADLVINEDKHGFIRWYKQVAYNEAFPKELRDKYDEPKNLCFCCEYACSMDKRYPINCDLCPIKWGYNGIGEKCVYGDYGKILEEFGKLYPDYKKIAQLSREIANLPEKIESEKISENKKETSHE